MTKNFMELSVLIQTQVALLLITIRLMRMIRLPTWSLMKMKSSIQ